MTGEYSFDFFGAFMALASRPMSRNLLLRTVLPSPGEGPDAERRENGYFRHLLLGVGADPAHRMIARVIGHKDPGYGCTAVMLGEAALSLAEDGDQLPDTAGVLTSATGIGQPLVERLQRAGMTLEVAPWPESGSPGF